MSLLGMIKGNGPSGFGYGSTAEEVTAGVDLSGKTVIVTGCNSGLGKETLRVMALRGARAPRRGAGPAAPECAQCCERFSGWRAHTLLA